MLFSAFKELFSETAQAKTIPLLSPEVLQTINAECLPEDAECIISYQESHWVRWFWRALLICFFNWLTYSVQKWETSAICSIDCLFNKYLTQLLPAKANSAETVT